VDIKKASKFNSIQMRFWEGNEGDSLAQFALATEQDHINNIVYQGNTADHRMSSALQLPLSDVLHLPKSSMLAFASSYITNKYICEEILTVSTPHFFLGSDKTADRTVATVMVPFPDPLQNLSPLAVGSLLADKNLLVSS
jgi:hypothetical protein